MELTREYFDKQLDKRLEEQTKELKSFVVDVVETEVGKLARMTSNRFDELEAKLDLRSEVEALKIKVNKVWDALNIKA